jgi:thymidine kinase
MELNGRLELIIGNMFSGKSTELIRRMHKLKSINKRIIVINYSGDTRYSSGNVSTHSGNTVDSLHLKYLCDFNKMNDYDCIFIDEGQFFIDLHIAVNKLVDTHHKHVIISGLDGDYNRKEFGDIIKLIPICDTVDKLTAYCNKCNNGTPAPFSKKLIPTGILIDIGGSDKYIPVCRYHYLN